MTYNMSKLSLHFLFCEWGAWDIHRALRCHCLMDPLHQDLIAWSPEAVPLLSRREPQPGPQRCGQILSPVDVPTPMPYTDGCHGEVGRRESGKPRLQAGPHRVATPATVIIALASFALVVAASGTAKRGYIGLDIHPGNVFLVSMLDKFCNPPSVVGQKLSCLRTISCACAWQPHPEPGLDPDLPLAICEPGIPHVTSWAWAFWLPGRGVPTIC
jgi:hypothetical protein